MPAHTKQRPRDLGLLGRGGKLQEGEGRICVINKACPTQTKIPQVLRIISGLVYVPGGDTSTNGNFLYKRELSCSIF